MTAQEHGVEELNKLVGEIDEEVEDWIICGKGK